MTIFQWILASIGILFSLFVLVAIIYDILAVQWGWRTISGMTNKLPRPWVFVVGLLCGLLLGFIGGHLWWPVVGN